MDDESAQVEDHGDDTPSDGAAREPLTRGQIPGAMAELRDAHPRVPNEAADRYWLRMGLGLGLRQPERAKPLLDLLEGAAGVASPAPTEPDGGAAEAKLEGAAEPPAAEGQPVDAQPDGGAPAASVASEPGVPLRSMLLARSAGLPAVDKEAFDPEAVFGWAARVTRDEVLGMGRVVDDMLAEGLSADFTKGFAITWRAGLRLNDSDFDPLFHAFTELEVTVGGVLAGYDLRAQSRTQKPGVLGSMLGSLMMRSDTRTSEAGAVIERAGRSGQRGLIAMWNAWAALRFREAVPPELFNRLVRPWVTVVGRLPEP